MYTLYHFVSSYKVSYNLHFVVSISGEHFFLLKRKIFFKQLKKVIPLSFLTSNFKTFYFYSFFLSPLLKSGFKNGFPTFEIALFYNPFQDRGIPEKFHFRIRKSSAKINIKVRDYFWKKKLFKKDYIFNQRQKMDINFFFFLKAELQMIFTLEYFLC